MSPESTKDRLHVYWPSDEQEELREAVRLSGASSVASYLRELVRRDLRRLRRRARPDDSC